MSTIEALRARIDQADHALLSALAERMSAVEEVLRIKETQGLPLFDARREADLLAAATQKAAGGGLTPHYAERVLREVIACSRDLQARRLHLRTNPSLPHAPRVAFQGTEGAYSWLASRRHFPDGVEPVGCPSFREAVRAVEEEEVDFALLPVENTIAGSIHETYDRVAHSRLHVIGEEVLRVEHCLLGVDDVPVAHLRKVLSHPVALQQCTEFLATLRGCVAESYIDTAEAARKVRDDQDPTQAAIASREAGELFGLRILREAIANDRENWTRFWLVGRAPVAVDPRVPSKASLLLVTDHREGALVACLTALAAEGVNMTKLESRPRHGQPFEYQFYIDVEGNVAEERLARALDGVRARSRELRVLGCYPRAGAKAAPPVAAPVVALPVPAAAKAALDPKAPLFSRARRSSPTLVRVGDVEVGEGRFVVMAGPCAVESREQMAASAAMVKAGGARILRGGAYKPRTSPYAFQGLGEEGVDLLVEAGRAHGLPVVSEVMDPADVEAMARVVDLLQVGARNMQNFPLLRELGRCGRPVLLKRGMMATIEELLLAAEYVLAQGNQQVILCERGIRTFETATRNTLDLSAVVVLKERTHLPVIVDPSHAAGKAAWVPPLARAAKAVGADGVIVEVHPEPEKALCDREQAVGPAAFVLLMESLA